MNLNGEVVGINTAILAQGQGIGFAIPINMAKTVVAQLKSKGEVTRGWLGVTVQDLKGDLAQYYGVEDKGGVLVAEVVAGDPADKAGIKAKDVILKVNGEKVSSSRDLTAKTATLGSRRDGQDHAGARRQGAHASGHRRQAGLHPGIGGSPRKEKAKDSGYGMQVAD